MSSGGGGEGDRDAGDEGGNRTVTVEGAGWKWLRAEAMAEEEGRVAGVLRRSRTVTGREGKNLKGE